MVDQADFTQTVMPHLDEAYNLARWVSRGDDRPQRGSHRLIGWTATDRFGMKTRPSGLLVSSFRLPPKSGHGSGHGRRRQAEPTICPNNRLSSGLISVGCASVLRLTA